MGDALWPDLWVVFVVDGASEDACCGANGGQGGRGDAAAAVPDDQVQGRVLLDVVAGECADVLELSAQTNEALLDGRDALLVLDLGLDVLD